MTGMSPPPPRNTTEPTVTCMLCGRWRIVVPDGRGFPPDIAKRKLAKECQAADCPCVPKYRAGIVGFGPVPAAAGRGAADGTPQ
jgi:hypothetical protein